jgi:hypothetical protein
MMDGQVLLSVISAVAPRVPGSASCLGIGTWCMAARCLYQRLHCASQQRLDHTAAAFAWHRQAHWRCKPVDHQKQLCGKMLSLVTTWLEHHALLRRDGGG